MDGGKERLAMVPIYEALHDIQQLKRRVLDAQIFRGYSGNARLTGGLLAAFAAIIMSASFYPVTPWAHVVGWGVLCSVAGAINIMAVLCWYRSEKRNLTGHQSLRPLLDLLAPFAVAAVLTFIFIEQGTYDFLPGMWMCLFGLMNIAARHTVPRATLFLGWYYIAAGVLCFIVRFRFYNPMPMGIVFGFGELIGGLVFLKAQR